VKHLLSKLSRKATGLFTLDDAGTAEGDEGKATSGAPVVAEEKTEILSCGEGSELWIPGGADSVFLAWYGDASRPWQVKVGVGVDVTTSVQESICDKNTVRASKTHFGDPCPWISKKLIVLAKAARAEEQFCPGIVVSIYRQSGALEAANVPNDFASLRRIICDKRMIKDHTKLAYHRALLGVRAGRASGRSIRWQPFCEAGDLCPCCHSDFDWMSTARSRKQRPLSMTNCRSCGLVTCIGCATFRQALPEIGIIDPARICDSCAWGGSSKKNDDALASMELAFQSAAAQGRGG